ncbi:MAG TPA: hypothetical protein VHZ50_16415 [Puia sp.]|jgi:hypothetical protein|nr:hypothetical protein [Puia sp.]
MTYTLGIPADGQSLGNSKPQVRQNFTTIFNAFAVNHVALDSLPQGVHNRVDLQQVSTPTPPPTLNTLFTQVTAIPLGELFYVRGGSVTPVQMTNGDPINASTGVTFLPGGILIQWGLVTLNSSGVLANIPFSPNFRLLGANNPPWSIQVTYADTTFNSGLLFRSVGISAYAFDKFSISSAGGNNQDVFWVAIGPRT